MIMEWNVTELRVFAYLDRLQPQFAGYLGTNMRGYLPVAGMAATFIEIAPGLLINQVADASLKAAFVQPGFLIVERSFGLLEFHAKAQGDVKFAGEAALKCLGMTLDDRQRPEILASEIIHKVNDYHAQVINVNRLASMLIAGQDLYVMEVVPAAYIALAVNEAEKNAQITIVDVRIFGAVGRLYVSGRESDVARAAKAAETTILNISAKLPGGPGG
jgi:hypothetical protein